MKAEGGLLEVGEGPAKRGRDNRRQWGVMDKSKEQRHMYTKTSE